MRPKKIRSMDRQAITGDSSQGKLRGLRASEGFEAMEWLSRLCRSVLEALDKAPSWSRSMMWGWHRWDCRESSTPALMLVIHKGLGLQVTVCKRGEIQTFQCAPGLGCSMLCSSP